MCSRTQPTGFLALCGRFFWFGRDFLFRFLLLYIPSLCFAVSRLFDSNEAISKVTGSTDEGGGEGQLVGTQGAL